MKRLFLILLAVMLLFTLTNCNNKYFQINPSTDASQYEMLGRDTGAYLKATRPDLVEKSKEWVADVLLLTDQELLDDNILQTAYEYLLKKSPENANKFLMVKSVLTVLGVKINVSNLLPEERSAWVECTRAILKGYSDATK